MKTAIITDSSAYLSEEMKQKETVFVLDIPITIDGETYIEGQNITVPEFYQKMAATQELPKTSQPKPSVGFLTSLLSLYACS